MRVTIEALAVLAVAVAGVHSEKECSPGAAYAYVTGGYVESDCEACLEDVCPHPSKFTCITSKCVDPLKGGDPARLHELEKIVHDTFALDQGLTTQMMRLQREEKALEQKAQEAEAHVQAVLNMLPVPESGSQAQSLVPDDEVPDDGIPPPYQGPSSEDSVDEVPAGEVPDYEVPDDGIEVPDDGIPPPYQGSSSEDSVDEVPDYEVPDDGIPSPYQGPSIEDSVDEVPDYEVPDDGIPPQGPSSEDSIDEVLAGEVPDDEVPDDYEGPSSNDAAESAAEPNFSRNIEAIHNWKARHPGMTVDDFIKMAVNMEDHLESQMEDPSLTLRDHEKRKHALNKLRQMLLIMQNTPWEAV